MHKIFLIDDHPLILESLKLLLQQSENCKVVGSTSTSATAIESLKNAKADIVIMDVSMPKKDAFSLVPEIKKELPSLKIIIYTMHALDRYFNFFNNLKVEGYVLKSGEYGNLLDAIKVVANGGTFLTKSKYFKNIEIEENQVQLNELEKEIIKLLIKDYTILEIAKKLDITTNDIMELRKNLIIKTGCQTTTQLLIKYKPLLND